MLKIRAPLRLPVVVGQHPAEFEAILAGLLLSRRWTGLEDEEQGVITQPQVAAN
jgi:hypothetical protein